MLVDRAFGGGGAAAGGRRRAARRPPGSTDALAAAALARAHGVPAGRGRRRRWPRSRPARTAARGRRGRRRPLRRRLQGHQPARRATPSLAAVGAGAPVVWVVGGLLKGASVDALGRRGTPARLRGAVVIGTDRAPIVDAPGATRAGGPRSRGRSAGDDGDAVRRDDRSRPRCREWPRRGRRAARAGRRVDGQVRRLRRTAGDAFAAAVAGRGAGGAGGRPRRSPARPSRRTRDGRGPGAGSHSQAGGRRRPQDRRSVEARRRRSAGRSAPLQQWLRRPLTSLHLVLGVFGLLTLFGLVMVLSASSVRRSPTAGRPTRCSPSS